MAPTDPCSSPAPVDGSSSPAEAPLAVAAENPPPVAVAAASAAPTAPTARDTSPAETARELKTRFPALFGDAPKPLKLRIQADIQERAPGVFTKKALSIFLHRHTGGTAYLVALSKAKQRFDLDGQAAGELSDEHRQAAAEELQRRRGLHEERRALEDAQRRNRAQLLRDFEQTTLTRSNFCALKAVPEEELDGLLEIARREVAEWVAQRPPRADHRDARGPRRDDGRPAQGPRRPAPVTEPRKPR